MAAANGYDSFYADTITTLDAAAALCEKLEACEEISMAWLEGSYYASEEYINLSDVKLVPFKTYES